jgi:hypothetical protein
MKNIVLIFLGAILFTGNLIAQTETIKVLIPRSDYTNFSIIDSNNDTVFLSKNEDGRILQMDLTYKIIPGKGRVKDYKGEKEKNKNYLVNSIGDTLLTLRESQKIVEFKDSTCYFRKLTSNGWEYVDSNGATVCEIELLWNDSVWSYELNYLKSGQNIEGLKKVNMLNLVRLAYYRSKCNCESDDDDDDFWFIMWLTSIATQ